MTPRLRLVILAAACLALAPLAGCGGGGKLSVRNAVGPADASVQLTGSFNTGVYAFDDSNNLHVLLIEGPDDAPTQAVHIRMYWRPAAGKTPIDTRSTNATVRYLVFTGDNAGVYAGAGFVFPNNKPGSGSFRGTLRSSNMQLDDASSGFVDRIGLASATGGFSATLDEAGTFRRLKHLERQLAAKLGYPRFVAHPATPNAG